MLSQQWRDAPERMGTMSPLPYSIEQMVYIFGKFAEDELTTEQVNMLGEEGRSVLIKAWLEGRADPPKMRSMLRRIHSDEFITIAPATGSVTLAGSEGIFTGYLDPDFKNFGTDVPSSPTAEQAVEVHEMIPGMDGNFQTIFDSTGRGLDSMLLTQEQIVMFCRDHRGKLRTEGFGTFFLFKVGEVVKKDLTNLFVAGVCVGGRDLFVLVDRFLNGSVWDGEFWHRFVLPQQTPRT